MTVTKNLPKYAEDDVSEILNMISTIKSKKKINFHTFLQPL